MLKAKKKLTNHLDKYIKFLMDHRTDESKRGDHRSVVSEKKEISILITALIRAVQEDSREAIIAEGNRRELHSDTYQWAAEAVIKRR